jgi:hypothetical protein
VVVLVKVVLETLWTRVGSGSPIEAQLLLYAEVLLVVLLSRKLAEKIPLDAGHLCELLSLRHNLRVVA